jgi:hypothetical protein
LGGVGGVTGLQEVDPSARPTLRNTHVERVDGDVIVYGEFRWGGS